MTNEQYEQAATFWARKDENEKKMDREELADWIDGFLTSHKVLALASGGGDTIRCTPLEYTWHDGALWVFTEGGLKFRGLHQDRRVAAVVFDTDASFGHLNSVQIRGCAEIVSLFNNEYESAAAFRKIPLSTLHKLEEPMWLLKIFPEEITCLSSAFRDKGFGSRQIWSAKR